MILPLEWRFSPSLRGTHRAVGMQLEDLAESLEMGYLMQLHLRVSGRNAKANEFTELIGGQLRGRLKAFVGEVGTIFVPPQITDGVEQLKDVDTQPLRGIALQLIEWSESGNELYMALKYTIVAEAERIDGFPNRKSAMVYHPIRMLRC